MATANHLEADGQTEHTNRTLAQYLRLNIQQNRAARLPFLPEAPENSLATDPAVGSQPPLEAPVGFTEQSASAWECLKETKERYAPIFGKTRCSSVICEPSDLSFTASRALQGSQEKKQPQNF